MSPELQAQVVTTMSGLDRAVRHATQRVEALRREGDGNAAALREQILETKGEAKNKPEKSAYLSCREWGVKLSRARGLTKKTLTA